jgi:hypothetical protein
LARGRFFRLAALSAILIWPAGSARSDSFPVDVAWFTGPLLTECEGPLDGSGLFWFEEGFDMADWDLTFVPFTEAMSGPVDRFFRGFFIADKVETAMLSFSSDDGIDIFVNSQPLGSWGRGCHAPGCVNMQVCGIIDQVAPVDITDFLIPGENLIAAHVTNCDCCCSMDFGAELTMEDGPQRPPAFRRADGNQDGAEDLGDAIATLNCLFMGQPCSTCLDSEDVNDDGALDLADPVAVLNHLFLAGEPPASPGAVCGPDPTVDFLDCESFPLCP